MAVEQFRDDARRSDHQPTAGADAIAVAVPLDGAGNGLLSKTAGDLAIVADINLGKQRRHFVRRVGLFGMGGHLAEDEDADRSIDRHRHHDQEAEIE